ncbi:MAG: hypothetical protein HY460_02910, partial [Parcubacteria group bacterium]|nr:hypothetical protein [Parcubacteria group bacterium]
MTDKRSIQFWTIAESTPSEHEDLEEGVGPYLLTTLAKRQGFDVSVFQASQYGCDARRIAEVILSNFYKARDIVAFSIFSGGVELLVQTVMRLKGKYPIIIGGPGATTEPATALTRVQDFSTPEAPITLVQAEAEDIFPTLLTTEPCNWTRLRTTWSTTGPGSTTQGVFGTLRNLDEKPLADLSSSVLRARCEQTMSDASAHPSQRIRAVQALQHCYVETRRGCFYRCEFCSEPQLTESGVRKTSPERAVREVAYLFENFGITFFNYADNIAFDSEAWWREYAERLQQLPYVHLLQFGGYGTPKFFSKGAWLTETLPLLYRTGLS